MTDVIPPVAFGFASNIIRRTFLRSASSNFLEELIEEQRCSGVAAAIRQRDTKALFKWLMTMLSYQGISNRAAEHFMEKHGYVTWPDVEAAATNAPCSKLTSYWHFEGCNYRKTKHTCARPDLIHDCHLPRFRLRNGHLNQIAVSLYLFIRDIAEGDFIGWIDHQLRAHAHLPTSERANALSEPLRHIYGVSHKVLSMLLSAMLLGADRRRELWFETGASFVVVDTLVHNYLHRTGILRAARAEHPYGPRCYAANGCASIIQAAATEIDASVFGSNYPRCFPRFVQHGIWRFCAMDGLDVCNGNRVDDRKRCENRYCGDFTSCERVTLNARNADK